MINGKAGAVIERLGRMPRIGESYDHKGRHGWVNPIRADTGHLLHALALAEKPQSVLEIGTAHGESGCWIATGLPPGTEMLTIEWIEANALEAQGNFDEAGLPVKVLLGDALEVIDTLRGHQPFDFVFLDANKDGYMEQVNKLRDLGLIAMGCLIVADNVTDRASEMEDFRNFYINKAHLVFGTECGLLVMRL